jgi:hypothetical protein
VLKRVEQRLRFAKILRVEVLGDGEKLLREIKGGFQTCLEFLEPPEADDHREQLRRIAHGKGEHDLTSGL